MLEWFCSPKSPLKSDLGGIIFAYDYRMWLPYTTTSPQTVSCKSDLRHHHDRRSRVEKCRSDLKHVLKSYDNRIVDNVEWRELCAIFLHGACRARSRNRMWQWKANVVPSKSAVTMLKGSAKIRNYTTKNKLYPLRRNCDGFSNNWKKKKKAKICEGKFFLPVFNDVQWYANRYRNKIPLLSPAYQQLF